MHGEGCRSWLSQGDGEVDDGATGLRRRDPQVIPVGEQRPQTLGDVPQSGSGMRTGKGTDTVDVHRFAYLGSPVRLGDGSQYPGIDADTVVTDTDRDGARQRIHA